MTRATASTSASTKFNVLFREAAVAEGDLASAGATAVAAINAAARHAMAWLARRGQTMRELGPKGLSGPDFEMEMAPS